MLDERELYDLKWFDYRPFDPDTATLFFLKEQAKRFVKHYASLGRYPVVLRAYATFDRIRLGKKMKRWKVLTELRQWCDKLGMPYGKFWEWACETHLELKIGKMYEIYFTNENLLFEVKSAWEQEKRNFIITSDFYLLHPNNYKHYEFQDDYYGYLVGQVKRRYPRLKWKEILDSYVENEKLVVDFAKSV